MKNLRETGGAASLGCTGMVRLGRFGIEVNGKDIIRELWEELLGEEEGYHTLAFTGTVHLSIERLDEPLTIHNSLTEEEEPVCP